jgi:hypothetical protein
MIRLGIANGPQPAMALPVSFIQSLTGNYRPITLAVYIILKTASIGIVRTSRLLTYKPCLIQQDKYNGYPPCRSLSFPCWVLLISPLMADSSPLSDWKSSLVSNRLLANTGPTVPVTAYSRSRPIVVIGECEEMAVANNGLLICIQLDPAFAFKN